MKTSSSAKILILIFSGVLLIPASSCRKTEETSRAHLLTSALWSLAIDWSGRSISDDEFSVTSYNLNGEYTITSNIRNDITGTWSLKENDETLIIDGLEYKIMLLTERELKITSTLIEGTLTFTALTSTIAATSGITELTNTSALLNGTLRTDNPNTELTFEYGTTISYGKSKTAENSPVSGPAWSRANVQLSGLMPETTYHYRLKAINSSGTFYGKDLTFTTYNAETISDIDGNLYFTVKIGSQVWMTENLKTSKYRNGDPIPNVIDNTQWKNLTTGAYCNYYNDARYMYTYGSLYNWYAVNDIRNIAPAGWHVATDADWSALTAYLGGEKTAASKLKETGTIHWENPNSDATNESGFTALPGGSRSFDGPFNYLTSMGFWWCSADGAGNAWSRSMTRGFGTVSRSNASGYERIGHSVRCVKN